MAWIVRTQEADGRVQLAAQEYLRAMPFGTNWATIRIGIRCSLTTNAAASHGLLMLGICQGTRGFTDPLGAPEYLGLQVGIGSINGTAWNTVAGPPPYIRFDSTGYTLHHLINGVRVATVQPFANASHIVAAPTTNHSSIIIDIAKGLPSAPTTWTVNMWTPTAAQVVTDVTLTAFLEQMNTATPPNLTQPGTAQTFTYTGANALDTLSVFYKRSLPVLEISDIAVTRWA